MYTFSGSKVVAEYVNGALSKEYVYAGSTLLATHAGSATTYSYPDHLSTRVEADANGAVTRTFGHYPFGETWYQTGTASKWKFTSYQRDSESGLDYAIFRYHSSNLGRFMSADPLAGNISAPQSLNRYTYVLNDPINLIDPLGLRRECRTQYTWVYEQVWVNDDPEGGSGAGHIEVRPRLVESEVCSWIPDEKPGGGGGKDKKESKAAQEQRIAGFNECVARADKVLTQDLIGAGAVTAIGGGAILGAVALGAVVLAESAGFEAVANLIHIGPATAPGPILYVYGIRDLTAALNKFDRAKADCQVQFGVFPPQGSGHK